MSERLESFIKDHPPLKAVPGGGKTFNYRGIWMSVEGDRDTWSYDLWLSLPKGPRYAHGRDEEGIPYRHQFGCGFYTASEQENETELIEALELAMAYIDSCYDAFAPFLTPHGV